MRTLPWHPPAPPLFHSLYYAPARGENEIPAPANVLPGSRLEKEDRADDTDHKNNRKDGGIQLQTLLDDLARAIAVAVAHERHGEEAHAARQSDNKMNGRIG